MKSTIVTIASTTVTVVVIIISLVTLFIVFRRRIIKIQETKEETQAKENTLQTGTIVRLPGIMLRQGSSLFETLTAPEGTNKVKPKFVPCPDHPGQLKVVNLPSNNDALCLDGRKDSMRHSTAHFTTHSAAAMPEGAMPEVQDLNDTNDVETTNGKFVTHRPPKTAFSGVPKRNTFTSAN